MQSRWSVMREAGSRQSRTSALLGKWLAAEGRAREMVKTSAADSEEARGHCRRAIIGEGRFVSGEERARLKQFV